MPFTVVFLVRLFDYIHVTRSPLVTHYPHTPFHATWTTIPYDLFTGNFCSLFGCLPVVPFGYYRLHISLELPLRLLTFPPCLTPYLRYTFPTTHLLLVIYSVPLRSFGYVTYVWMRSLPFLPFLITHSRVVLIHYAFRSDFVLLIC